MSEELDVPTQAGPSSCQVSRFLSAAKASPKGTPIVSCIEFVLARSPIDKHCSVRLDTAYMANEPRSNR